MVLAEAKPTELRRVYAEVIFNGSTKRLSSRAISVDSALDQCGDVRLQGAMECHTTC